jgi:hypothetical protein
MYKIIDTAGGSRENWLETKTETPLQNLTKLVQICEAHCRKSRRNDTFDFRVRGHSNNT